MKKNLETQENVAEMVDKSWEDSPWVLWMISNWKHILWVLALLVVTTVFFFRITSSRSRDNESDFISADTEFQQIVQSTDAENSAQLLQSLTVIMERHPELHAKYDDNIAQILIARGETAPKWASEGVARTQAENSPYYTSFAEVTFLISQNQYDQALDRSLQLHNSMQKELSSQQRTFGDSLFAANLLRIAFLQQELQKNEEKESWELWKSYLQGKHPEISPTAFEQQVNVFNAGKLSLLDYVQHRLKK